ncbi:serine/threonine-protein kinase [Streptomyces sp. NPDC020412]|uniref:serine/threonine-protein kinase n=1 Tax=Streptomyces sp. NPDC020412 TaxID=3365073 RepID=UPI00379B4F9A
MGQGDFADVENEQGVQVGAGLLLAGRYRLVESIGRGGMGRVWRARDEVLHRVVAVKELTAGKYASDADRIVLHARTQKEARAAARITHPGVVTVHDVLEHDQRPWIVMQYVDGPSLAEAAKEADGLSALEAARIGLRVLRALGAAHAAGVLHRDVKPANVLLARDGNVLLTDFGIAAIEGDSTITRTGEIIGSIDYLAPERVRGADPGPASDLWSLGATLYAALEGQSPFRRTSPLSSMQAVVSEEPARPAHAGPLEPVIMALLAKEPAARPVGPEVERMLKAVVAELEGTVRLAPEQTAAIRTRQEPAPVTAAASAAAPPVAATGHDTSAATRAVPHADTGEAPTATPPAAAPPDARASTTQLPAGEQDRDAARPAAPAHTAPPQAPQPPHTGPPAGQSTKRRGGRLRRAAIVVLLSAVVGGGAGFAAMKYGDSGDDKAQDHMGTEISTEGATNPGEAAGEAPAAGSAGPSGAASGQPNGGETVPEGWQRLKDPLGFSVVVPEGWERISAKNGQADYSPDGGKHLLRIGVNEQPESDDPYDLALQLERELRRLPNYERTTLERNTFQGRKKAALWEFSWTERQAFPGDRHGVDQLYQTANGTEYALYLSGPAATWAKTRGDFDTMLKGWRAPDGA